MSDDDIPQTSPPRRRAVLDDPDVPKTSTVTPKTYDEVIAEGKKSWKRIKRGASRMWDDWINIAQALERGRDQVMDKHGLSNPKGKRFNTEFGEWLRQNEFDIDETTRSHLTKVWDNYIDILDWRFDEDHPERLLLNHPVHFWKIYQADLRRDGIHSDDPKPTKKPGLKETNLQLQAENDELIRRTAELEEEINAGSLAARDTIAEIDRINRRYEANEDLEALIDGLIALARRRGIENASWDYRSHLRVVETEQDDEAPEPE